MSNNFNLAIFTQIKSESLNSQQQIIKKINEYSKSKTPFFLFVDFEMQKPVLYTLEELVENKIYVSFPNYTQTADVDSNTSIDLNILESEISTYRPAYDWVRQHLQYGNSYLTNLTGKTKIESSHSLTQIFAAAKSLYKIQYKDEWVCFSPECFIKIKNGEISSFPMKGTIDASLPNAMQTLMEDQKEIAEHYTIVDLIRNDLSMVATNVKVENFRYIDYVKSNHRTLLQASSVIVGQLPDGYHSHLGEILFALLPAGSISGAPKAKTIEIIQQAENEQRGFYTGVAFYFDGTSVDSCVLIRFVEQFNNELYYRSGGGITVNSELAKEYQELLDKIYVPIY